MRYIVRGHSVASELAAKPEARRAMEVVRTIEGLGYLGDAVDYGCGKLRYSSLIADRADTLLLVDSEVQLSRRQLLGPRRTTVQDEAIRRWPFAMIETIHRFAAGRRPMADFVLCANVLSAIPSRRTRRTSMLAIRGRLRASGRLLVVTQFRNSHYDSLAMNPNAERYADGWLIRNGRRASFYGLLDTAAIHRTLRGAGFCIEDSWTSGQSALVTARPA